MLYVRVQLRHVLSMVPSVAEMQACIERSKQGEAGGELSSSSPSVVLLSVPAAVGTSNIITSTFYRAGEDGVEKEKFFGEGYGGGALSLRQALNDRHPLSYLLLRWLLSS